MERSLLGQPTSESHPHLIEHDELTVGITREEYRRRRERLMELVLQTSSATRHDHIVVVPSATEVYMTADIPYRFRQNSDFLYLAGFKEPDGVLVLENKPGAGSSDVKSTLFVRERDADSELWTGPRSGVDGVLRIAGVDEAYTADEFASYLNGRVRSNVAADGTSVWYDGDARTYQRPNYCTSALDDLLTGCGDAVKVESIQGLIHRLRVVKSEAECALMKEACDITCNAFRLAMRHTEPMIDEAFIQTLLQYQCRLYGAQCLAYPPVVAGGARANIIHYTNNDQRLTENDFVLVDAGCEYHGYNSDVTRVWPVRGTFTEKELELYEALLWVQERLIMRAVSGNCIGNLYNAMLSLLAYQLKSLSIIPRYLDGEECRRAVHRYCPHDVGHYLGMDIHDTPTISRHTPLEPGMIITIEPGLYIPEDDESASKEWRGIGMRIEDDILITSNFPNNLTEQLSTQPGVIQQILSNVI